MSNTKLNLDHIVVVVPDLVRAIEQYRTLGFTVSFGGDNGPTHNALIPFDNGTYIELISMRSTFRMAIFWFLYRSKLHYCLKPFISPLSFRFFCWMGGPTGIRDWCIRQEPLDRFVNALESKTISVSKIEAFTRTKPNSEKLNGFWQRQQINICLSLSKISPVQRLVLLAEMRRAMKTDIRESQVCRLATVFILRSKMNYEY